MGVRHGVVDVVFRDCHCCDCSCMDTSVCWINKHKLDCNCSNKCNGSKRKIDGYDWLIVDVVDMVVRHGQRSPWSLCCLLTPDHHGRDAC